MNENSDGNVVPYWPSVEVEEIITADLKHYLRRMGQHSVDDNVHSMMGIDDGFSDRFNYLDKFVPNHSRSSILISGCSVGSEMILAHPILFGRQVRAVALDLISQDDDTDLGCQWELDDKHQKATPWAQ